MALGMSSYMATAVLNAFGNNTAFVVTQAYLQLHTADPGAAGTTAIAANATRKAVSFGVGVANALTNDANVDWTAGEVDGNEDYTHFSFHDAGAAGNFLLSGLMTSDAVLIGNTFRIPISSLTIAFSGLAA